MSRERFGCGAGGLSIDGAAERVDPIGIEKITAGTSTSLIYYGMEKQLSMLGLMYRVILQP